jgi:hypothetical protein
MYKVIFTHPKTSIELFETLRAYIYSHNMGSNPKKSMNGVFFLSMNF